MKKKSINQIRVEELTRLKDHTSDGSQRIALAAIHALPYSMLKRLTECLDIEEKCQGIKRNQ